MPTQAPSRPFFANFFAAFRARSVPGASASSLSSSKTQTTTSISTSSRRDASTSAAQVVTSQPRPISTSKGATSAALQQLHSPMRSQSPGPLSTSPGYITSPRSQGSFTAESGSATPSRNPGRRRGSDSSSELVKWRENMGGEKWYVGGRTAQGEERYFRMNIVAGRRDRSLERSSVDRMSL